MAQTPNTPRQSTFAVGQITRTVRAPQDAPVTALSDVLSGQQIIDVKMDRQKIVLTLANDTTVTIRAAYLDATQEAVPTVLIES